MITTTSRTNSADALRILEDAYAYYPGNALHQRPVPKRRDAAPAADLGRYA